MKQKKDKFWLYRKTMEFCRHFSIRYRLLAICIFVCIVPTTTIGLFAYKRYEKSIVDKLSQTTGEILKLLDKNITTEMSRFDYIGNQILVSDIVQNNILNHEDLTELEKREISLKLNELFNEKITISEMVKGVYILDDQKQIFYNMGYEVIDEEVLQEVAEGTDDNHPMDYITAVEGGKANDNIIISKAIYSADGSAVQKGYFVLIIDEATLKQKTYQDIQIGEGEEFFIINTEGMLISALDNSVQVGKKYPVEKFITQMQKKEGAIVESKLKGKTYITVSKYQTEFGWYLVSMLPSEYINSEVRDINIGIVVLCIFFMMICLIIVSIVMLSIQEPIKRLVTQTEIVSKGEYPEALQDPYKDEISYLTKQFDKMVIDIKEFQTKEYENNKKKRAMEIKMLQAQINPHFLFNTLNSLKWIAMMSRVQIVAEGIDALAQLLRGTLSDMRELIFLEDEIHYLEQYFMIQKLRYGDSFEIVYQIPKELKKVKIIKFLLQPIVENSILHGTIGMKNKIEIQIQVEKREQYLYILIKDNGCGFDIEKVKEKKTGRGMSGIGIWNVKERIEINYGKPFTMNIESTVNEGTQVKLILPFIFEGDEEKNV